MRIDIIELGALAATLNEHKELVAASKSPFVTHAQRQSAMDGLPERIVRRCFAREAFSDKERSIQCTSSINTGVKVQAGHST